MLKPLSSGFMRILSISICVTMNDPINKKFYFCPKPISASLESKSNMSCSKYVRKSYGTKPPSIIKLFMKAISGYGNSFLVEFRIRFERMVFTRILRPRNLSLRVLSRISWLDKGIKSIDSSPIFMIVSTGVLIVLISHPLKTSL